MGLNRPGFSVERIIQQSAMAYNLLALFRFIAIASCLAVRAICTFARWICKDGLRRLLRGERDARAPKGRPGGAQGQRAF